MNTSVKMPVDQLTRAVTHEPQQDWPDSLVIRATWGKGKDAQSRHIEITADQFFGNGQYGAPVSGDWLVAAIDRLRRKPNGGISG